MTDPVGTERHGGQRRAGGIGRWFLATVPYLAAFWLVLSGQTEPLFVALGALSLALVCWLCWRAGLAHHTDATARLLLRLLWYLLWLAKEVLWSAAKVVRRVWSPRPAVSPVIVSTSSSGLSELGQVIYANSITLTPGTLSLDLDDDDIEVHGLVPAAVDELQDGAMLRRVRRLEARR